MKFNFQKITPDIDIELLGDKNMTDKEFRIYTLLVFYIKQNTFIQNKKIAEMLKIDIRNAIRITNNIIKKGYLISEITNNNTRTLSLPKKDKAPYSTEKLDYNDFKKAVLDFLEKEKMEVVINTEIAGLLNIYKKDNSFWIRKRGDSYRVWNIYKDDYMSASDASVFWREFWLKHKDNIDTLYKILKGCKNG
jgi:DNA-binding MarR family transcriptional regulator